MAGNGITGKPAPAVANLAGGTDPSGNIQSLQVDSSKNLKVVGTFTATNASVGLNGQTAPTSSNEVSFIDGSGNLQPFSGTNAGSGPNVAITNFPTSQPINGTVTANQGTAGGSAWPVSVASLPLPSGASTSALQTSGNASLTSIDGKTPALGQALAAASVPIVLTADQITTLTPLTTVAVTQTTGTNLHTVIDSSALPTGAATSANQATEITSLSTIATNTGNIPAKGSATSTNSTPVVIASDQASVPIKPQSGTLTDRSGTTSATPSTSTQVAASNTSRKYFIIENVSTTNTIWINFTTAAASTQPSIQLLPGGSFVMESSYISTEAINVLCTVASSPFSAKEG